MRQLRKECEKLKVSEIKRTLTRIEGQFNSSDDFLHIDSKISVNKRENNEKINEVLTSAVKTIMKILEEDRGASGAEKTHVQDLRNQAGLGIKRKKSAGEILEAMKKEALLKIGRTEIEETRRAWYHSYLGSIDFAVEAGMISQRRRLQLYKDFKEEAAAGNIS